MATFALSPLNARAAVVRLSRPIASSSLPVSSLASVCRPRRHPRLRQVRAGRSLASWSLNESLIGQPLPASPANEAVEPRHSMILHVAVVQAEGKFINIAIKMLDANVVIDADQAALENGEDAFNAIGSHVIANVFARTVIDRRMIVARAFKSGVYAEFVSVHRRANIDV